MSGSFHSVTNSICVPVSVHQCDCCWLFKYSLGGAVV